MGSQLVSGPSVVKTCETQLHVAMEDFFFILVQIFISFSIIAGVLVWLTLVEMAVRYIEENLPTNCNGLWAVINNAGTCVCGEFDWQTLDQIQTQVSTNILGSLSVTKHC